MSLPLGTHSLRGLLNLTFPPVPYWIDEGILRHGSKLIIGGEPKSHKSFVLNSILADTVLGGPLFGTTSKKHGRERPRFICPGGAKVLLIEQEIGELGMQERFQNFVNAQEPEKRNKLLDNIFICSRNLDLCFDTKLGRAKIEEIIAEVKPDIVAFDPLVEFHSADENSAIEMKKVFLEISTLQAKFNFATILTHHSKKPQSDGPVRLATNLRGSGFLFGKVDAVFMLTLLDERLGKIIITPTLRHSTTIGAFQVRLNSELLKHEFQKWGRKEDNEEE